MGYETYRVEITRDESREGGPVAIEITAYIDRMPETNHYSVGLLTRVPKDVWNSRLQYAGDFDTLAEALAAVDAAYPDAAQIRCYDYTVDQEYPVEVALLVKSAGRWAPRAG